MSDDHTTQVMGEILVDHKRLVSDYYRLREDVTDILREVSLKYERSCDSRSGDTWRSLMLDLQRALDRSR